MVRWFVGSVGRCVGGSAAPHDLLRCNGTTSLLAGCDVMAPRLSWRVGATPAAKRQRYGMTTTLHFLETDKTTALIPLQKETGAAQRSSEPFLRPTHLAGQPRRAHALRRLVPQQAAGRQRVQGRATHERVAGVVQGHVQVGL